jgi:hypothetical protein
MCNFAPVLRRFRPSKWSRIAANRRSESGRKHCGIRENAIWERSEKNLEGPLPIDGRPAHDSNSKVEPRIMRYELRDYEWAAIRPMLPNKARGVPRVDDRRVLNGICWVLRSGAPWRDSARPSCACISTPRALDRHIRRHCFARLFRWAINALASVTLLPQRTADICCEL